MQSMQVVQACTTCCSPPWPVLCLTYFECPLQCNMYVMQNAKHASGAGLCDLLFSTLASAQTCTTRRHNSKWLEPNCAPSVSNICSNPHDTSPQQHVAGTQLCSISTERNFLLIVNMQQHDYAQETENRLAFTRSITNYLGQGPERLAYCLSLHLSTLYAKGLSKKGLGLLFKIVFVLLGMMF